jgi:hypothetical protein
MIVLSCYAIALCAIGIAANTYRYNNRNVN